MVVPTHILANMTPDDFIDHLKNTRRFVNDPDSNANDVALLEHAFALRFHELCHDMAHHITPRSRYDFCIETLCAADTSQKSALGVAMLHEIKDVGRDAAKTDDVELAVDCNNIILHSFDTYIGESQSAARRNYLLVDFLHPNDIQRRYATLSCMLSHKLYMLDDDTIRGWTALTMDDALSAQDKLNGYDLVLRGDAVSPDILDHVHRTAAPVILECLDDKDAHDMINATMSSLCQFLHKPTYNAFWTGWLTQRTLITAAQKPDNTQMHDMRTHESISLRRVYNMVHSVTKQGDLLFRSHRAAHIALTDPDLDDTFGALARQHSGRVTDNGADTLFAEFAALYDAHVASERGDARAIHDILFAGVYRHMSAPATKTAYTNPLHEAYRRVSLHSQMARNLDDMGHRQRSLRTLAANRRDMLVRAVVPALKQQDRTDRVGSDAPIGRGAAKTGAMARNFDLN